MSNDTIGESVDRGILLGMEQSLEIVKTSINNGNDPLELLQAVIKEFKEKKNL